MTRAQLFVSCIASTFFLAASFLSLTHAQEKPANEPLKIVLDHERLDKDQLRSYVEKARKWDKEVFQLAAKNLTESNPEAILFLGSSSIRRWDSIAADVHPWLPIRRGYGGAKYCDLAIYTPTLVRSLQFKAAVIFIGNDVTGSNEDKTPEEVARLAKLVLASVRESNPKAPVLLVSVTATPSRFKHWNRISEVNEALRQLANASKDVRFLDTKASYLNADGSPKPEYFVEDKLHQNADGYKVWGRLIRDELKELLGNR